MLSITFDNFSIRFGKRVLFDAVRGRLVWDSPGVIGLMGPSGSGKSTLINALLTHRYQRPIPGLQVEPGEVAMVSVPQQPVIYPQLSVDATCGEVPRVVRPGAVRATRRNASTPAGAERGKD
jgi:ABC-type multidrug transport system ATPase subunit